MASSRWAFQGRGAAPFPSPPTRDHVIDVRCSFQGLSATLPGVGVVPLFGPFCYSLDAPSRAIWRASELGALDTHAVRAISYGYDPYPLSGRDFTEDLPTLKALLAEDIIAGITPTLYLAGDGQTFDPVGLTHGYPWLMANMARVLAALRDRTLLGFDFSDYGSFALGFELISYGGWSPDNFETATLQLRSLIPNGYIASHIGTYTWWGDVPGSPNGGPVEDWASPTGQAIDICFEEGDWPVSGENADGWQQRAAAHLGPDARNIEPKNQVAWEWPARPETPRGRRTSMGLEIGEYPWTHNETTLAALNAARDQIRSYGFALVG